MDGSGGPDLLVVVLTADMVTDSSPIDAILNEIDITFDAMVKLNK